MRNAIVNTKRNVTRRKFFLLIFNWCFIKNERFSCHELLIVILFLFWNLFLGLIWLSTDRLWCVVCAKSVQAYRMPYEYMDLSIQNVQLLNDRTGKNNYTHHQRKSIWSELNEKIKENKKPLTNRFVYAHKAFAMQQQQQQLNEAIRFEYLFCWHPCCTSLTGRALK